MGRPKRVDAGGYAYHVLNRTVGRRIILRHEKEFVGFESVLEAALGRFEGRVSLLVYCVMGNHWHLVLKTTDDGDLGVFMQWLTLTHTQRYRTAKKSVGQGPLYQGRFKSFLIDPGGRHLLSVCRCVGMSSEMRRVRDWWSVRKTGVGQVFGVGVRAVKNRRRF